MSDITPKQLPIGQYEYVDVVFGPANTNVTIPYTRLRLEDREKVRWIDVTRGGNSAGVCPTVYRVIGSVAERFGHSHIVLRCNVADYTTRLLLFVERNED